MKTDMAFANRAWRKATINWGMDRKKHRQFCRNNAMTTVENATGDFPDGQIDWDSEVAEELTYWGD